MAKKALDTGEVNLDESLAKGQKSPGRRGYISIGHVHASLNSEIVVGTMTNDPKQCSLLMHPCTMDDLHNHSKKTKFGETMMIIH